ncbi:MAG: lasso peptide biosynthesis B2 protein [Pseudomonadota bacterium]
MSKNPFVVLKHKLTAWHRLPAADKILFFEAAYFLGVARLSVAFIPFKRIAPTLGTLIDKNDPLKEAESDAKALKIAHAIARAVRYTPWESVCLPQAIAAQRMLRRRGLGWNLYLGVAREEGGNGLKAHAWLRNGSKILCGASGHRNFTVVSVFSSINEAH